MKKTGAQIFHETLLRLGVKTVFGYPGGNNMPIYDAMYDSVIHHVLSRHEQGAVHMADGYARISGEVGVAIATSGPGATNMVTGIANAMLDSIPIVCFTGQVPLSLIGQDAFQEVDITGVTLPVSKHNYLVTDIKDLSYIIREAFYIAKSGRPGPVVIDIPKSIQLESIEWEYEETPFDLPGYTLDFDDFSDELNQAVKFIENSRKPIVLAGQGVMLGRAAEGLRKFAEKLNLPVINTLLGLGCFPHDHPLFYGMLGMHGLAFSNHAVQESDLIIALGMRFDDRATGNLAKFAPHAKVIHVDVDASELSKNVPSAVGIQSDIKQFFSEIDKLIGSKDHGDWVDYLSKLKADHSELDILNTDQKARMIPAHIINTLYEETEGNAVVVSDVGQNQMWAAQYYHHNRPYTSFTSGGLGTMGFALPAAIGAKMARRDEEIWVIIGDGGFQMCQSELATLQQENLNIKIMLLNNGYLGMVRQWQELFFDKRYAATPITGPDFVKLADAFDVDAMRVDDPGKIRSAIQAARKSDQSMLLEFMIEPEHNVFPMVPSGANLDEMLRRNLESF